MEDIVNQAVALGHQGFDTIYSVQGVVIAVIAAALMRRYSHIIGVAIGATIIHEIVTIARGVIAGGAVQLPDVTNIEVLKLLAMRFVGYFVAISIVYLVRRILMRS
tara:strand:+ start:1244 stop:1561 length:318 start_codon:yes stop_codon:yes gene_type:complete